MKMKLLFTLFFISAFSCFRLQAQFSRDDFARMNGLTGAWRMVAKNGLLYEKWLIENDSTMKGISFKMAGADSIPLEEVILHFNKGMIIYTAITANQNKQQPVDFTLITIQKGQYIFENRAHDFPQQVTYKLIGNDSLHATINGTINNNFKEITYSYSRLRATQ